MSEPDTRGILRGLGGELAGVLNRHKLAAFLPAILLGAGADVLELLRHHVTAEIAIGLALALWFELYVGYAELLIAADHEHVRVRVGRLLRRATVAAPALVAASLIAVSVPLAATGLLVLPGLYLMTIWSLFAPAMVHEHLGVRASLKRSSQVVRRAFWAVAFTVTASVLIEHAVIHATAHSAEPVLGSQWLALIVTAVAVGVISPPAAFTISLVYDRLLAAEGNAPVSPPPEPADRPAPRIAASAHHGAGPGR
jgi:hypothetical protein